MAAVSTSSTDDTLLALALAEPFTAPPTGNAVFPGDVTVAGTLNVVGPSNLVNVVTLGLLQNAVDDSHAAAAGVNVQQLYRNGSVVMVRVFLTRFSRGNKP